MYWINVTAFFDPVKWQKMQDKKKEAEEKRKLALSPKKKKSTKTWSKGAINKASAYKKPDLLKISSLSK